MDFFEKMGEELTNFGNDVVRVTKDVSETAKLHGAVLAENNKINEQLRMIGEIVYEKYKADPEKTEELGEEVGDCFFRIGQSEEKILEAKNKLAKNKGGTLCPQCGNTVPKGSSFCNNCGKVL